MGKGTAQRPRWRPVASSRCRRGGEAETRRELDGKGQEGWQGAGAGRQGISIQACSGSPGEDSVSDPKGRGSHQGGSGRGAKGSELSLRKSLGLQRAAPRMGQEQTLGATVG